LSGAEVTANLEPRRVEVRSPRGHQLHVRVAGTGPLVLMVHGFPESSHSWRHQVPVVAAHGYTAAAMDVLGYGESDKPTEIAEYSLAELAGCIAAVIDGLSSDGTAVVVGHDWGAPQVYAAAVIHPDKVRGVVGLSSPFFPYVDCDPFEVFRELYGDAFFYKTYFRTPGPAEAELEVDPRRFLRIFLAAMSGETQPAPNIMLGPPGRGTLLEGFSEPPRLPSWLPAEDLDVYAQSLARGGFNGPLNRYRAELLDVEQLRPYADRKIEAPSVFIGGAADPSRFMIPGVDRYADPVSRMADVRGVHILDGVGHWVQQEAPEAVNARLLSFLNAVSGAQSTPPVVGRTA
jgi:pimeloyl-ACP methyl ester carboxylesterase